MDGVTLTPLRIIEHPKGDILHGLKSSDPNFSSFGEAYFSVVHQSEIKGWKRHWKMILNLVVPVGEVKFVVYDDRLASKTVGEFASFTLSRENYFRLTVRPGLWVGFQGLGEKENVILNVASIEHDPEESDNKDLGKLSYPW